MTRETIDSLATSDVNIDGSVHSAGEAYLTVQRLHTIDGGENLPVSVRGSLHAPSHEETDVESTVETLPDDVPGPADNPTGFTEVIGDDRYIEADVVRIDRLYVASSQKPTVLKSLGQHFEYVEELRIVGSVHSPGVVEVIVGDLYVVGDEHE